MCERSLAVIQNTPPMSYEIWVTILLAIVTALLAMLGLGIGILALWGYRGMREAISETVSKAVPDRVEALMAEYREALDKMKKETELTAQLQAQLVPQSESKILVNASKPEVQEEVGTIPSYPGDDAGQREVGGHGSDEPTGKGE